MQFSGYTVGDRQNNNTSGVYQLPFRNQSITLRKGGKAMKSGFTFYVEKCFDDTFTTIATIT